MEEGNTPEGVYRRFMLANLTGDEATIRPLILDNEDAHLLWQGAYPKDVAAALAEQYRQMEIVRLPSPDAADSKQVLLKSSASPIPLVVVNLSGTWKLDAAPIIAIRKAAK